MKIRSPFRWRNQRLFIMFEEDTTSIVVVMLIGSLILISGRLIAGTISESDREVLESLRSFLELHNRVNRGRYTEWNQEHSSPCYWPGISCDSNETRVTGIDLSNNNITGPTYTNFSALTSLSHLDLSMNTIYGSIPDDLSRCTSLIYLNLSHNIIQGKLNLVELHQLEILDLSVNRLDGDISSSFASICRRMKIANLSTNNFNGTIDESFRSCRNLQYLDLSANQFVGGVWNGFSRLREFSVSQNRLTGSISSSIFNNCSLEVLDLSENRFRGGIPKQIKNCEKMMILNLWGNKFHGKIPLEIGLISNLQGLFLGNNTLSREIPESLLNLSALEFLDLSRNSFGGEIQSVIGRFNQVKFLVLHGNSYTGGIRSSGIMRLKNVSRLDLSYNNFTGGLPREISDMASLKYLMLAFNQFSGQIPSEYGSFQNLQALDLAFNRLTGQIPKTIGNLTSLLWLTLANNSLTGEIPAEIGNCRSLLWLNLANNRLSGTIPAELTRIGKNPWPAFQSNYHTGRVIAGSGECLTMKRWIPVNYPPFSFVYTLLTRKSCRNLWDRLLKGHGLFPICLPGSTIRSFQISGYLQLAGNKLSGELPPDIGTMQNFSLFHFGNNRFSGSLPSDIGHLQIVALNVSGNKFSGDIPADLGFLKCLQNLDLSNNNFSGKFPMSLINLTELNKFNVSFNPFLSGMIPSTGQLPTFGFDAYLGDSMLQLPSFIDSSSNRFTESSGKRHRVKSSGILVFAALILCFAVLFVILFIACTIRKIGEDSSPFLRKKSKHKNCSLSSDSSPFSDKMKINPLDPTRFTYSEVLHATCNFEEDRVLGKGGYGTVYRGKLADGREVAVKKLLGERAFRAEMKVLRFLPPHPNLVRLYGWCDASAEKILVYEYMPGGSLEELVADRTTLTWQKRVMIAADVARGLSFLHHDCIPPIVHRDVKASNVLLGGNASARVTDFGLSRPVDAGESHVSTIVAGTIGYVAPEYGHTWQATTKGDVYSFGVLVMELATARRAVDGGEECLVEWGRRVISLERATPDVPPELLAAGDSAGSEKMRKLLRIGVKCTSEAPRARPSMRTVVEMLVELSHTDEKTNLIRFNSIPSLSSKFCHGRKSCP